MVRTRLAMGCGILSQNSSVDYLLIINRLSSLTLLIRCNVILSNVNGFYERVANTNRTKLRKRSLDDVQFNVGHIIILKGTKLAPLKMRHKLNHCLIVFNKYPNWDAILCPKYIWVLSKLLRNRKFSVYSTHVGRHFRNLKTILKFEILLKWNA